MRINKYKLKKNTTLADVVSFGARDGGGWIQKGSKYFLSKKFYYKETDLSVSINITFEDKLSEWNDFDNVLGRGAQVQTRLHQRFVVALDAAGVVELVEVGRNVGDVLGDLGGIAVAGCGNDLAVEGRE